MREKYTSEELARGARSNESKAYFQKAIKQQEEFRDAEPDQDDSIYNNEILFLQDGQQELEKLYSSINKNKHFNPSEVSNALSELSKSMGVNSIPTGVVEVDQENKKAFEASQALFMDVAKRVYGEKKVAINDPSITRNLLGGIQGVGVKLSPDLVDMLTNGRLGTKLPKFLEVTDQLLVEIGREVQSMAVAEAVSDKPNELTVQKIVALNGYVYEINLLRQEIQSNIAAQAEVKRVAESSQVREKINKEETKKTEVALENVRKEIGAQNPERETNKEKLIKQVLQEGGFRAIASLDKEVTGLSSSGFIPVESRIKDNRQTSSAIGEAAQGLLTRGDRQRFMGDLDGIREVLAEHRISEMFNIQNEQTQEYDEVIIPGKKGIFGFGATPDRTEQKPTGRYRSLLHGELVQGGKSEPAVRFSYIVSARNREWRGYDGRGGQMLSVEFVLPESVAKEFATTVEGDPKLIRDTIEKIMKEKILKKPDEWDKSQAKNSGDNDGPSTIRPPYEQWDKVNGGAKIYIQKAGKEPGFHQEFVHKIK